MTTPADAEVPGAGVLYSFRRCPYAIRARMALAAVAGGTRADEVDVAALEVREVLLRDKPASMRALSPKATVPVLALNHRLVLDESLDIMRWVLARAGDGVVDSGGLDGDDARALLAHNDGPFKASLDRYKYARRYADDGEVDALQEASYQGCLEFLGGLERRLAASAGKTNLSGDAPGPLDWAIFPFVRQFAGVDPARFHTDCPSVSAWKQRHEASALFRQVMTKLVPWQPDDAPIRFDAAYPAGP